MTDIKQAAFRVKKLRPNARLPLRASESASGYDVFALIDGTGTVTLGRHPQRIGTGIAIEVPPGYDVQVRPRSGLSAKGVGVAFGTIDSDYRGEVLVTMYVYGDGDSFQVRDGDRIAQLVITRLAELPLEEASELSVTDRGAGGHGSTGR